MTNKQKLKHLKIKQKRDEFVRIAFSSISPPEIITEKELLKKSGIIVMCILAAFIILLIAFNAKPALAYTGSGNASDIKANSYINTPVGLLPGTGTTGSATTSARFRWYYGTTSTTGTGSTGFFNPGSSTMTAGLPYIDFLFSNGTSTLEFNGFDNITIDGIAITTGILTDYVKSTNGTATGLVGTNTTHGGTNTIPSDAVFTANGRVLTAIELSYLDNLSDFLTTLLAEKQADLGGTYCASISDGVGTSTGAIDLRAGGDLGLSKAGNVFTYSLVGTPTAKPDIYEGGTLIVAGSTFLNFNALDFDAIPFGTGTILASSLRNHGTTNATADMIPISNGSGTISLNWFDAGFCYAYRTIPTGSVIAGTWTNIGMDSDLNDSKYGTHSTTVNTEQIKLLVPGMYEIGGMALTRTSAASIGLRLCKNNGQEIPGSFSMAYMNYGDASSGMPIIIAPVHVRLAANDYVYMQVAHNHSSNISPIDYLIAGTMPSPGTSSYAHITIRKIGE